MARVHQPPATAEDLLPLALTSYGHFTTLRVDAERRVRGLSLHLERLVRDSEAVFGVPVDTGRVRELIRAALDGRNGAGGTDGASASGRADGASTPGRADGADGASTPGRAGGPCTVRVTHFDPAVDLVRPERATAPRIMVTVRPAGELSPPPLTAMSVRYERDLPEVKHCGLFGALHARRTARLRGFDDALFVGADGRVTEGGTWNVGFVDAGGTVVWPRGPVLPGVTAALLRERTEYVVAPVTLAEAKGMRAAFATNTSVGVRALAAVDDTPLAVEHPVLSALREVYSSVPGEEL
ncbi:aminotransferase class IV [Streptomyces sp. JW3]|uniref:aminotransferase class IV n=1 Tax=Streptomyces sp. JW3 TaxID=3456955 RepID=UPI003FA40B41